MDLPATTVTTALVAVVAFIALAGIVTFMALRRINDPVRKKFRALQITIFVLCLMAGALLFRNHQLTGQIETCQREMTQAFEDGIRSAR